MAKRVVLSRQALQDRKQILSYWRQRNKSDTFSKKLNNEFKQALRIISDFPQIGKPTDREGIRIKIVRDYILIYKEFDTQISVLTIWDTRQHPDKISHIV